MEGKNNFTELIKGNYTLLNVLIKFVILLIAYFISEYIIQIFKLKVTQKQFVIAVFALYLVVNLLLSWI
ncbi:hypothetical protein TPENAI_30040 [Tenacibaculum litopenaei]